MTTKWARNVSNRAGAEVRRLRGDRTAQWLSDRTAELGHRVGRSRISDLERGLRGSVLDVAELGVIAASLGVPATALLFPTGPVEALPGQTVDAQEAIEAFTGEQSARSLVARVRALVA